MSEGGKKTPVGKRSKGKKEEPDDEVPCKKYKDDFDQELEDDEEKMGFTTPPPTFSHLSAISGALGSARRDKMQDKPAELFRKDLISAMKLPDSEPLQQDDYVGILDPWRQDWERGVQVPVNLPAVKEASVRVVEGNENLLGPYAFKLPKKYLHAMNDETYRQGQHELHETQTLAEQVVRYDLDDLDVSWLALCNEELRACGESELLEWQMERVMEALESQCYAAMQEKIQTVEGLGIEYDENIVCDVCRSPDSEDTNEMVFCDNCDICVHQACYGIQKIPDGNWLCRTCALGIRPRCVLCPRSGGAMKSTKSGSKWTHVSCALWIPEVSIGCPDKMEPITKISQIPSSRWSLICSVCRERTGACIQCCVKTCKTAFHVTCAFHHGLDMKTILDEDAEDVVLKGYCAKHTKKKDGEASPSKSPHPTPRKESEMTEKEKTELRSHRLETFGEEFYSCVSTENVARSLDMDVNIVDFVYGYWVLKRKSLFNKQLLMPQREEADILSKQREDSLIARMKMFIHLRQDLERVRNLCYMVGRREKVRRQLYRLKEEIFHKQVAQCEELELSRHGTRENSFLMHAHKLSAEESIYDQYDGLLRTSILLDGPIQKEDVVDKPKGPGRPKASSNNDSHIGQSKPADLKESRSISCDVEEETVESQLVKTEHSVDETLDPDIDDASDNDVVDENVEMLDDAETTDKQSRQSNSPYQSPKRPLSPVTDAQTPGVSEVSKNQSASGSASPVLGAQSPLSSDPPSPITSRQQEQGVNVSQARKTLFTDGVSSAVTRECLAEQSAFTDGDQVQATLASPKDDPGSGGEILPINVDVKDESPEISDSLTNPPVSLQCEDFDCKHEESKVSDYMDNDQNIKSSNHVSRSLRSRTPVTIDSKTPDEVKTNILGRKRRSSVASTDLMLSPSSSKTKPTKLSSQQLLTSTDHPESKERENVEPDCVNQRRYSTRRSLSSRPDNKKSIITSILARNSLIVSNEIRSRVQEKLVQTKVKVAGSNGGLCKHTQRKLNEILRRRTIHDISYNKDQLSEHKSNTNRSIWSSFNGTQSGDVEMSQKSRTRKSTTSESDSKIMGVDHLDCDVSRSSTGSAHDDLESKSRSSNSSTKIRHFPPSVFGRSSESKASEDDSSSIDCSDSDYAVSEVLSESGCSTRRRSQRLSSKANLVVDELSRDSLNSFSSSLSSPSKYGARFSKTSVDSSPFR